MKKLTDDQKQFFEGAIAEIVARELAPARVTNIFAELDVDHDGDEIMRITIVFEAEHDRLNPSGVSGLARNIRSNLRAVSEKAFPVFSFRAAGEPNPEAA